MQHWSKLEKNPGGSWPVGRAHHAATCLGSGGDHPQLMISGGYDDKLTTFSDIWILDVTSGRWREVSVGECKVPCGRQNRYQLQVLISQLGG